MLFLDFPPLVLFVPFGIPLKNPFHSIPTFQLMTDIIVQVDPDNCTYGTTRNSCGRTVCQKGPGEMCGGRFGRWVDLDDVGDDSDDGGGDGGDGVGDKFYAACNIYLEKLKSPFKKIL